LRIRARSIRDAPAPDDGARILVDRLWPRGVSRGRAALTEWRRELAPSDELRRWFGHDPVRWNEFRRRYRAELAERGQLDSVSELGRGARREPITLLFGASDREHNNAVALLELIEEVTGEAR
jgi:uncharacterized protein YeaO (DUF488 family)